MAVLEREIAAEQRLAEALGEYAGRWVAVSHDQSVIADASSLEELLGEVAEAEKVEAVFHVPEGDAAACYY